MSWISWTTTIQTELGLQTRGDARREPGKFTSLWLDRRNQRVETEWCLKICLQIIRLSSGCCIPTFHDYWPREWVSRNNRPLSGKTLSRRFFCLGWSTIPCPDSWLNCMSSSTYSAYNQLLHSNFQWYSSMGILSSMLYRSVFPWYRSLNEVKYIQSIRTLLTNHFNNDNLHINSSTR